MPRLRTVVIIALVAGAVALGAGCTPEPEPEPIEPAVAPPVIGEAGVLRVGVDLDYPPFAGEDKGEEAGIDIDVAAAVAESLGLSLDLVQVAPSEAATALADGTVDIVMSVPFTEEAMIGAALAGSYISDGPAFFSTAETTETLTLDDLAGRRIAAQQGSQSYWIVEYEFGESAVLSKPTLREAFDAADAGEADVVVGSAVIGTYLLSDFESLRFAGEVTTATPLGIAVAQDNAELEETVRTTLDALAANAVLDAIEMKWLGPARLESSETTLAP